MVSPVDLVPAPSSTNDYIDALTGTYAYRPGYTIVYALQGSPGDTGLMGGALWAQQGAAQAFSLATQAWAAVANLTITAASTGYDGSGSRAGFTWVEKLQDLGSGILGQHSLPGPGNLGGEFNNAISLFTTANNAVGGYSFLTFLHEIGHGLGLTHPHEEGNSFPGVTSDDDLGDNGLNQAIYTVMSYNDGIEGTMSPSDAYGWSATPMAFDIAAIQNIYGANMSTATGNNVYTLPKVNGAGTYWTCIWDAGGVDTITAAGATTGCTIDLRAATLLDEAGGGGWLTGINGIAGGFTIAHNAVIENATGGSGNDAIRGNEAANLLIGGGGEDDIWGYGGNDRIESGNGYSHLYGGDGDDILIGGTGGAELRGDIGNDVLQSGGGTTFQYGGVGNDLLIGGSGNDTMYGDSGTDTFVGGAGDDRFYIDSASELVFENAGGGTDTIYSTVSLYLFAGVENLELDLQGNAAFGVGNALDNRILGNNVDNLLLGGGGNDEINANNGNDQVYGESGNDVLRGGGGIDYMAGGAGNDTIEGNAGADAIYGEDGDDILYGDGVYDPYAGASGGSGFEFVTDILVGGAGNDILYGASGLGDYDLMDGGAGNDTYYVDTTADLTFEAVGGGTDTVYAKVIGNGYYLYANVENLILVGNTAFGVGNDLANRLTGSEAGNWLLGGAGNDLINGKAGNDVLFGEAGADTFVFEHGTGGDTIGDFAAGTDMIDLSAFGFASFAQVQAAMIENGGTTAIVLGDGDYIVLNGVANAALHTGDFILSGTASLEAQTEQLVRSGDAGPVPDRAHLIHLTPAPMFDGWCGASPFHMSA